MGSILHVKEERKELVKDIHRLARFGVLLMIKSDSGEIIQNGAEYLCVVEFKKKTDNDPMLLQVKGTIHNQRVEVSPKWKMVYFAIPVDCVFLMWVN